MEEKMNRELLEKQFEPSQIKKRKGNYGKNIDYVETAAVIQRLNDSIDGDWSFEIVEHIIQDDDVAVLGKLSTNGVTKMQWGSRKIGRNNRTGAVICLGDDLKSAASDSLKKAASLLGCGLHLYTDEDLAPEHPVTNKTDEKVTPEQLANIKKLRESLNWGPDKLQERAKQLFAPKNEEPFTKEDILNLNPTMADALIKNLENEQNNNQNQVPF